MLSLLTFAMLTVGFVEGQATIAPASATTVVLSSYNTSPLSQTPSTTLECWKSKDYGAGVTGSIPIPTYVVSSGSIGHAAASSGVHCYEMFSTNGGVERIPLPTAPPASDGLPSQTPTPISSSANSHVTSLHVLLPSIIVPICGITLIALAAILLRHRPKSGVTDRKWFTLKDEENNMSEKGKTTKSMKQ